MSFVINDHVLTKYKGKETHVTIPDSVTAIGICAFSYCESLESIVIPAGVKKIVEDAFKGCTSLQSITIPGSVTEIGMRAFADIPDLTICGKKGSEAERYAKENGVRFEEG